MKLQIVIALVLAAAVFATASRYSEKVTVRTEAERPENFVPLLSANEIVDSTRVRVVFAVKQKNLDLLKETVWQVSNPKHVRYGQFLSLDELTEMIAVPENAETVRAWLEEQGAEDIEVTATHNYVTANMPIRKAEVAFKAQFMHFENTANGKTVLRVNGAFELPMEVHSAIDYVSGVSDFPKPLVGRSFRALPKNQDAKAQGFPAGIQTPDTLQKLYQITDTQVATTEATSSVYESLGQDFSTSDVDGYLSQFGIAQQASAIKVIGPNDQTGCSTNPNNCGEAELDLEIMLSIAANTPMTYWSIAQSDQTPYLDWAIAVSNDQSPPLVHSMSYGSLEPQYQGSVMDRFDTEVQGLASRGITVIIASGDDGVWNFQSRNNPSICDGSFVPSFPASAPHVTAVGATQLKTASGSEQILCTAPKGGGITSGSGFSTHFDQPSYQTSQVQSYLNSGVTLPDSSKYTSTGRVYPDVAAMGADYAVYLNGKFVGESGTSASAPLFASMVTLINAVRIQNGKSSLGFLNQALYQADSSVFTDITEGTNNCSAGSASSATCCNDGFSATSGWDAVTGNGAPIYPQLKSYLANL